MNRREIFLEVQGPGLDYRTARRRRESRCCTVVLVLVMFAVLVAILGPRLWRRWRHPAPLAPAPSAYFPLNLTISADTYQRYDLVPVTVEFVDQRGLAISGKAPAVWVEHNGERISGVAGLKQVPVKYRPEIQRWHGYWPIPWHAERGEYTIVAETKLTAKLWAWETPEEQRRRDQEARRTHRRRTPREQLQGQGNCRAFAQFRIEGRQLRDLAPGTCIATYEQPVFLDRGDYLVGPDGSKGDWHKVLDWAHFIGADTVWFLGGTSNVPRAERGDDQDKPWHLGTLEAIPQIARQAKSEGFRFGVWAIAYRVRRQPGGRPEAYRYALDAERTAQRIVEWSFVSLLDQQRPRHLAELFAEWNADPNIDHLGLDYIRAERGYEIADLVVEQMGLEVPDEWKSWSKNRRMLWMAHKIEVEWKDDPKFYERWNWWRAHRTSRIVRSICRGARVKKPVWCFILSWKHGTQHGQDPYMFADAGMDYCGAMLYQAESRRHFEFAVKHWQGYAQPGELNLLVGDQVDDDWHQERPGVRMRQPRTSVEEFYRRLRVGTTMMMRGEKARGIFVHDVGRIISGKTGPYGGREWALAGAAAASELRNNWGLYPIALKVKAPRQAALGQRFTISVAVTNRTDSTLNDVEVSLYKTVGVTLPANATQQIPTLNPRAVYVLRFDVAIPNASPGRRNRFMVAAKGTWPRQFQGPNANVWPEQASRLPRQYVQFAYVNAE